VAPGILVTSSPDLWTHVNKHPGYRRSDWYYHAARVEYRRDNVFTQTNNDKHDRRRKQMAPGYSGKENLELEPAIDVCLAELLDLMRTKYVSPEGCAVPVDLAKKIQYFTLDVISSVGLGQSFGMLRSDCDLDQYIQSSEEGLIRATFALAMGISWMAQAPILGRFIAPSPKDKNGFGKMMAACFRYVDNRTARDTEQRSDMLASFIRHGVSGEELKSEALEQIIAGSDTTAGAIRGALLHLMTNPRVYAKLQREVDDAVRDGKAPPAAEGLISSVQARQLPYLQAVIRESMRTRPPVANIFSRDVPPAGDTVSVDGETIFFPPGTCIGYSALPMHRSEKIYGKDNRTFRPERWFDADGNRLAEMVRTNNLIFGHGRFLCLGKTVAMMELEKALFEVRHSPLRCPSPPVRVRPRPLTSRIGPAALLLTRVLQLMRNFDLALVNPTRPWKERNALGLFLISDMWVQVMERGHAVGTL